MTDAPAGPTLSVRLHAIRRVAIITIIVSLSLTALVGIITLLAGSFGEVQGRIMLTTLIIGVASVLALCDLAVLGRRFHTVGFVGVAVSLVGLVAGLVLIWTDWAAWSGTTSEWVWKVFGLASIAAVSLAQATLLLLLGERRRSVVRGGLWVTIALIAAVLVLLWLLILTDGEVSSEGYARLLGSAAILDVLGTILVPVTSRFLRDSGDSAGSGGTAGSAGDAIAAAAVPTIGLTIQLSPELDKRLDARAKSTGKSRQDIALAAVEKAVGNE